ncbi:hypothetical protein Tco_1461057, partial [Tanacetum coccineum]
TPGVFVSKKKAPAKAERSKGIELLYDVALLEEAQLKKVIKRSKRETKIHQACGSSEGSDFESEVPDEPKAKSIDISEGTGLKPGVPDVSKADSSKNEYVHTPEDYVPTDDETDDVDDEEYDRINKELYDDVNVNAEHEEVSQEVADDQVKDDAKTTVTAALATDVPLQSSSISSDYATKFLNLNNIALESETLAASQLRVTNLEKEVQELRNVDNSFIVISTIKYEVPNVVKEFLGTNMDDALYKVLKKHNDKKKEKMYYPRFTKAIIHHFISKDKSISMRNRMFMHTVQHDCVLAYKTYLAFAIGATPPKKTRKFKKPASPSKKKALVAVDEPIDKSVKKPVAKRQSAGIELLSDVALLEEAQLKKLIKRSKRETNIHQPGGSIKGADFESEVPDEPKAKSINISEGTGLKPGVPDHSDDERTESVNPSTSDDEEETQEYKYVHTLEDYVPTNDETEDMDDEEYDRINKELCDDMNVGLMDAKPTNEEIGDEEMTHAE